MRFVKGYGAAIATAVVLSFLFLGAQGALAAPAGPAPAASEPKTLCAPLSGTDEAGGVYPASSSKAYVGDWTTGALYTCSAGSSALIASAPSGAGGSGYYGLAGVKSHGSLDLLLLSDGDGGHGWYCLGASTSGCTSTSSFTLPASFCEDEAQGFCSPAGVVVTSSLGFTYVDPYNADMVTCKAHATSCTLDAGSSVMTGEAPFGIVLSHSIYYVSDNDCAGDIWSGTPGAMMLLRSVDNSLGAITVHNNYLFVANEAICRGSAAAIENVTAETFLPSPFTTPAQIDGLDSDFQFSNQTGEVYSTK